MAHAIMMSHAIRDDPSFSQLCMPQSSRHLHIRSAASCAARRLWKCISAQLLLPAYLSG